VGHSAAVARPLLVQDRPIGRLNRILARSGRKAIREKPKDLQDRLGSTFAEVNPVYSPQTRSAWGLVSKAICQGQSKFSCRGCGHEINAGANAVRDLESGRSSYDCIAPHGRRRAKPKATTSGDSSIRGVITNAGMPKTKVDAVF